MVEQLDGFVVLCVVKGETWMDFEVFEVTGYRCGENGEPDIPTYQRKGSRVSPDFVYTLEEAEVFAEGFVKWDGCLEFRLTDTVHFCGRDDGKQFGQMVADLWLLGQKLIPAWDNQCADTEPVK